MSRWWGLSSAAAEPLHGKRRALVTPAATNNAGHAGSAHAYAPATPPSQPITLAPSPRGLCATLSKQLRWVSPTVGWNATREEEAAGAPRGLARSET